MRTTLLTALLLLAAAGTALAQRPVEYEISFPNAIHHEAEVAITFPDLSAGPLQVRMSRSSPGRYALHEFAKNVYSVRASDGAGHELPVTRPGPHQWDVAGHDGTVRFTYTLFADRTDGTYAAVDETHAHLNLPATFAWARGLESRPITVRFRRPDDTWKIATQLAPTGDPERFTAPHLQYFLDSPTEISDHMLRSWRIGPAGREQTVHLAVHHLGTAAEMDAFTEMVRAVVAEEIEVYGEAPDFDFGSYTFIACYLPWADGDGMEHRNSTVLTSTRPLDTGTLDNLGTVAHEFFHAWNVERIRPATLEPFDFTEANLSDALWFAEGFTQYYTPLVPHRAGITSLDALLGSLGGMVNAVVNAPGRRYGSPVEMSQQAPFVDAATSVDPQNKANTFISYYTWGGALGLALDLSLRQHFDVTLDGYLRALWERFGEVQADFAPRNAYTVDDLRHTLGEVTGSAAFADDFFARYVQGREIPDFESLLATVGLALSPANPGSVWLGATGLAFQDGAAVLTGSTLVGSPLHAAGLDRGDRILSLAGRPLTTGAELQAALSDLAPDEAAEVVFESRGTRRIASLAFTADPRLHIVAYERAGRVPTAEMLAARAAWTRR